MHLVSREVPEERRRACRLDEECRSADCGDTVGEDERLDSLEAWLHDYDWHRYHTAIGAAPATRLPVNNL